MMFEKGKFTFIIGPCLVEDHAHAVRHATHLRKLSDELHVPVIYKSSFIKDNRTKKDSPRGDWHNLKVLADLGGILPTITDVHKASDVDDVADYVDALQIPAMLSRQTSLLEEVGGARMPTLLKKGQGMTWEQAYEATEKIGHKNVAICERGTTFGYNRLIVDFEALGAAIRSWDLPVYLDATHSTNLLTKWSPFDLAKAACSLEVDGIFAEVHENPDKAPSDGPRMIPLADAERFMEMCLRYRHVA